MTLIPKAEFEARLSEAEASKLKEAIRRHNTYFAWSGIYEAVEFIDPESEVMQFVFSVFMDDGLIAESRVPELLWP